MAPVSPASGLFSCPAQDSTPAPKIDLSVGVPTGWLPNSMASFRRKAKGPRHSRAFVFPGEQSELQPSALLGSRTLLHHFDIQLDRDIVSDHGASTVDAEILAIHLGACARAHT